MELQSVFDWVELLAQRGVINAVLCPGSRSAPLTIAFSRHDRIRCWTVSDERSAGFMALGMAQQTQSPTVVVCTSGSAAYNLAPAVAEAFYSQTPLLVLTADRPEEWIDQLDGQTIRQPEIFGRHVKHAFELPQEFTHPDATWYANRQLNEAVNLAQQFPQGPVHINCPFREPLYPSTPEPQFQKDSIRKVVTSESSPVLAPAVLEQLATSWSQYERILVVGGQQFPHASLVKTLDRLQKKQQVVIIGDVISNLHGVPGAVRFADGFLGQAPASVKNSLKPELIVTFGLSVISKNLKIFLRQYRGAEHWHIQPAGVPADTYQQLTQVLPTTPEWLMDQLLRMEAPDDFAMQKRTNFVRLWQAEDSRYLRARDSWFHTSTAGEFAFIRQLMPALPARCNLHLANSMSVRYANFVGLEVNQVGVHVYSNRGTSGIDGCTSTAAGYSLTSDVPNILLTGDLAFFYDRNAFWHNYPLPNLHVVVINNHGGVIFNLIDGPGVLAEKEEYFVTRQSLSARHLAGEFGIDFTSVPAAAPGDGWKKILRFEGRTKILEVEGQQAEARSIFEAFKQAIRKSYES